MKKIFTAILFTAVAALSPMLATAGMAQGSLSFNSFLAPGESEVYEFVFKGGEQALVTLKGNGESDLDIFVYDEFGNIVAQDSDYGDRCMAVWGPTYDCKFTIKVINLGDVSNDFELFIR